MERLSQIDSPNTAIGANSSVAKQQGGDASAHHNATDKKQPYICLLYTSPSPRDRQKSRMPSSA